ncbi:uncharacterized protein LOC121261414 [Juglans microcarpa x Juglans regia]|uniref:uncharacterized protein LOC121243617 n=1 Tax=Juglans microcarpa x Juglans regia TaxID=2249226 RepID=UPI001B7F4AFA|nr:uncharacterized protein LOC121243617 [Juglans microcarpa x Juglans regia]XP_041006688.1 uncharacterized protein LOC121251493 [Juglans microcarpa x Juglans regia]XP_041019701.1 uncharacterized protein LOC121261414 [Juglans microcarpa x Juglans regia]
MSCCSWATKPPQAATEDAGKQASTAQLMFSTTVRNSHAILRYCRLPATLRRRFVAALMHGESPSHMSLCLGSYGTRSTSAILFVKGRDEVDFYKRHLGNELVESRATSVWLISYIYVTKFQNDL